MYFATNLRLLRRKHQQSQQQLAENLGYRSFTTIQKWESSGNVPPLTILNKIALDYGINVDSLINKDLSKENQLIPVLGKIQAGFPITAIENINGFQPVSYEEQKDGNYFYLEVQGDSMKNLRILPGDLVYIRQQDYLEDGEIGIVMINEEVTLKRIKYKKNKIVLLSENENYPPLEFSALENEISILGKLVHNKIIY